MIFSRHLLACVICFTGATAAAAEILSENESLKLLERVARAPAVTSFQGVYLQQHGEHMESISIYHLVDGGVINERREMLDGPPREMLRHGDEVSVHFPDGSRLKSFDPRNNNRLFPRLLPDNPAEILLNYTLRRGGRERVAGLDADLLDLEPRDRYRYPHRLWVHVETSLLLKAATLGFKRELFDLYAFSQLKVGNHIDRNLLKPVYPVRSPAPEVVASEPGLPELRWDTSAIPPGFRLIQQSRRTLPGRNQPVLHHLYSDGVVSLSVFVEQASSHAHHGGLMRQGALAVYGHHDGNYRVTAMGEVPPETVRLFARAYKLVEKQVQK